MKTLLEYLKSTGDLNNVSDTLDLTEKTLLEVIEIYLKRKEGVYPNIRKQHSSLIHNIKCLEKDYSLSIMPHQITDIFWYNFIPLLLDKGIKPSTLKNISSRLKTILDWAGKYGATVSTSYDLIKLPPFKSRQISLTPDEVSFIYHFNINTIPRRKQYLEHLDRVRDMFVLSCNLGQRYSDMCRLDKLCFNRNIFTITQQKTGVKAIVDIDRFSIDSKTTYKILKKYNYNSPISNGGMDISCFNKYLKDLLKYIGEDFNEIVSIENKICGEIVEEKDYKWNLITSHTARRTFATINVLRGNKESEVRKATGHLSESSFERYLCM